MAQKVTSTDIKLALKEFHNGKPSYFITECKTCSTYFPDPQGLLKFDGLAITKSYTKPNIIGYEIKVSRNDFLQDNKWHLYLQYCNEFYFVVPKGRVKKDELPDHVGLIYFNPDTKALRTVKKALYRQIEEPVGVYKYIIFSRLEEDRIPFYNDRAEYCNANDPQAGEILYSISVADESTATADYMPPFNGIGVSSLMVDLVTAVSNASSVKVNVDPTAGATVAQIVNLQEQIDDVKSFVGYESSDVYGVEVDFVNKKFTRLAGAENLTSGADFDKLTPWGGRKRCNLTNEGVMVAYRGETGYSEAGATSATITKGTTEYPSGTKVQTMVEQPLFYTKVVPVKSSVSSSGRGKKYDKARFYISPTPKAGFKPVDGFLDDNGILQDKIYLSAFEGSIFDTSAGAYLKADEQVADFATDMLSSIAGAKAASGLTQNLTRANVRKLCTNRGKGWKSHNIFALTATQWLILVEYASMNAQSVIGQGVSTFTDDGSTNMAVVTGATSGLGNGSGIDPNAGVDGKCSVSYRGEENLWGNIWTWLDAINIYNDKASGVYNAFVKPYGECKDDTTADGYKALDFNIATGEGYISGFGYDEDHPDLFLCAEHNGASNLPVGDYYWNNNDGFRVATLGGRWDSGARCGAWCLSLDNASSSRDRSFGGRLLYVPQTKISA